MCCCKNTYFTIYAHISLQIPRKMQLITQIFIFTDSKTHLQFTIYHCNSFYRLNMNMYFICCVRFYICQRGPFPKGCSTCALNLQLIQMLKWSHRNKRGRVRCKMKGTWTLITEKYYFKVIYCPPNGVRNQRNCKILAHFGALGTPPNPHMYTFPIFSAVV